MSDRAGLIQRASSYVRRHGLRGLAEKVTEAARDRIYLHEEHVWYELRLAEDRPTRELEAGVSLIRATSEDLPRLDDIDRGRAMGAKHLAAGNDLWLAADGEDTLFGCWTFRGDAPAVAAPGGVMHLPPGVVCLEDSVTTPAARGRGIAPASWYLIANLLQEEGLDSMITKVEVDNQPSRKAVLKAGFRELGVMTLDRRGPRKRVRLTSDGSSTAEQLVQRLSAG